MLSRIASRLLPGPWRSLVRRWSVDVDLSRRRRAWWGLKEGALVQVDGYTVGITDGPNLYMQYKDEFIRRIYHFDAGCPDPRIIDGGSNVGMSILAFKRAHPAAHVVGFEPDPEIYRLLQENVTRNGLKDVVLINAALGEEQGSTSFVADHSAGGRLASDSGAPRVRVERLSDYLQEPVDFLKLNVEGAELAILQEVEQSGKLQNIAQMVLEYHGWPRGEQRLGDILNLLDRNGFRYLIHDFDAETCAATKPPFHVTEETMWFCLIYARRIGGPPQKV